jgi:hypothetical protein
VSLDSCGLDLCVGDSSARAIENGTRNGSIVRLRSSRYSGECKKKAKGNKPQQGHIESHFPPQKAPTTEQALYFAGDRISNSCSPSKRTIEIPAVRHITGKNADEPLYEIGFRNRLFATSFINAARGLSSSFYFLNLVFRCS